MSEVPSRPEQPFLTEPRPDEKLRRQLSVYNIAEYALAGQYHRIGEAQEPVLVPGVYLERRQSAEGTYDIYRDPVTGEIYKSK